MIEDSGAATPDGAVARFLAGALPPLPVEVADALGVAGVAVAPGNGPPVPWPADLPPPTDQGVAEALAEAARRALDGAVVASSGGRQAAFGLLTADALLTWACEAAAGCPDPAATIPGLLERMVEGSR